MCNISKGVSIVSRNKKNHHYVLTYYKNGYTIIFKFKRRAYILNNDGTFRKMQEVIKIDELNIENPMNNIVINVNFNINIKMRVKILNLFGIDEETKEYNMLLRPLKGIWPSLLDYNNRILNVDLYLFKLKELLDRDNLSLKSTLQKVQEVENCYKNSLGMEISVTVLVVMLKRYTLLINDKHSKYDYIMYQVSDYLIAGNADINIKGIYFKLQDERLINFKLKIIDVDDKFLNNVFNLFSTDLKKISDILSEF